MNDLSIETLVRTLELEPHPEGGFYRETYRAQENVATERGPRAASTSIYFLITRGTFSALHRIRSDESWHFHAGAPLRVITFDPVGKRTDHVLGLDLAAGQRPFANVPAGHLFGARIEGTGEWSLVGCTVAPGFDFEDFELPERRDLLARYPAHAEVVRELTREGSSS